MALSSTSRTRGEKYSVPSVTAGEEGVMDWGGVIVEEKGRTGGGEGAPKVVYMESMVGDWTVMLSLMLRWSSVRAPGAARSWWLCRPRAVMERVSWRSLFVLMARFWHWRSVRASLRGPHLWLVSDRSERV